MKFHVLLLASLFLAACSNAAPPYRPTATSVPPAASGVQGPTSEEVYDLPMRCAEDTAAWFKQNHSQPKELGDQGGGSATTISLEYQNHFSLAKKRCFAVLSQLTSFKGGQHSKAKDYIELNHSLWDVNQNSKLGAYEVKNVEAMTECNVAGGTCTSKDQWLEMIRPFIAE